MSLLAQLFYVCESVDFPKENRIFNQKGKEKEEKKYRKEKRKQKQRKENNQKEKEIK